MSTADEVAVQLLQGGKPAAAAAVLMGGDLLEFDDSISRLLSVSEAERVAAEAVLAKLCVEKPQSLVMRLALVISSPITPADLRSKCADILVELVDTTSLSACAQFSQPCVTSLQHLLIDAITSHLAKRTIPRIRHAVFLLSEAHPWPEFVSKAFLLASSAQEPEVREAGFTLLASFPGSNAFKARARELHSLVFFAMQSTECPYQVRLAALGAAANMCCHMADRDLMNDVLPYAIGLSVELKTSGYLFSANKVKTLEESMTTLARHDDETLRTFARAIIADYVEALSSKKLICSDEEDDEEIDDKVLIGELKSFSAMSISPINAFSGFGIALANYQSTDTSEKHKTVLLYFALLFLGYSFLGFGAINAVQVKKKPDPWMVSLCIWIVMLKVAYVEVYAALLGIFVAKANGWLVSFLVIMFGATCLLLMALTVKRPRCIVSAWKRMRKAKPHQH